LSKIFNFTGCGKKRSHFLVALQASVNAVVVIDKHYITYETQQYSGKWLFSAS